MIENKTTLIESAGVWPECSVEDVVKARTVLECDEHVSLILSPILGYYIPVSVRVSQKIYEALSQDIPCTRVSYIAFLEKNGIAEICVDSELDDSTVLVCHENDAVQINNVKLHSSNQRITKEDKP